MSFVTEFDFGTTAAYRAILDAGGPNGGFRVAGMFGDGGVVASLTADGETVWQNVYAIAGQILHIWSGVLCDDGDLMIHGSLVVKPGSGNDARNQTLVLRLTPNGDVRWAKTYTRDRTRFNLRLVKGPNDTYFFASWYNASGDSDDVEIVKIDGAGNVLAAVDIDSNDDDQLVSIVADGDGCIVFGGTGSGPGFDGFIAALDGTLRPLWMRRTGDAHFQQITAIARRGAEILVLGETEVAGVTSAIRHTFIGRLSVSDTKFTPKRYAFQAAGPRLLIDAEGIYLAGTLDTPAAGFVARFDTALDLLWQRTLKLSSSPSFFFSDIEEVRDGAHGLVVTGGDGRKALLAYTDLNFASCVTADVPPPPQLDISFPVVPWIAKVAPVQMDVQAQKVDVHSPVLEIFEVCPSGISLDLSTNARFQSPYIILQAAGSDFSDATVRGFHLRWDLLRSLASHIPKGNLAAPGGPWPTTIGYNRADDFVRIYRAELRSDYGIDVTFATPASTFVEGGRFREWLYEGLGPHLTDVSIRFADVAGYDAVRASVDPHVNPQAFIVAYSGVIEARAVGKLAFSVSFQVLSAAPASSQRLRVEVLTLPDPLDNASRTLGCRRTFTQATNAPLFCENIESIRFDYSGVIPVLLHIATYEDFIRTSSERQEWRKLGDYSLDDGNADADAEVFRRLETPAAPIDGVWPKFQRVAAPGVFRVRAQSYRDRWRMPAEGLKAAVTTYLDASRTDVNANVVTANEDPLPNSSAMELSYLDLLNFVTLDYHVARMLGLGAIDANPTVGAATRFVYLMQYVTDARLEREMPKTVTHYYMTPPLRIVDYRMPPVPTIHLSFGLSPEKCGGATSPLTDPEGYALFADARFINVEREPLRYEKPLESFFQTPDEFCLCDETVPVCFGVRYGPGPIGAGNEVQPELSNNPPWTDAAGLAEVAPIPERGENPVYTHEEHNAGIHHYSLYSINWFSRPSPPSADVQTDATKFARRNTLLPPSNFVVQLIQKEDPPIFTTPDEQDRLAHLPAGDGTLVRVTFDWNHVQNDAYQSADTIELYFRARPPATVRGKIVSVTDHPATHTATIVTDGYLIASPSPPLSVQPEILPGDEARFAGARMTIDGRIWLIESVVSAGVHPTLIVKQIRETASLNIDLDQSFCTLESWRSPKVDDRFIIVENLDAAAAWNTKLTKEVGLVPFTPLETEIVTHNDGQSRTVHVGGLSDSAVVTDIFEDPGISAFVPPGGPASVPSGAYRVRFSTRQLAAPTDPDVDFYQGVLRIPDLNGGIRVLPVWSIDRSQTTLELVVVDSSFDLKRGTDGKFVLDASHALVPVDGYVPIRTGFVANVNFHPSYRVYLTADVTPGPTPPPHNFGEQAILPARGAGSRQTFMTARSRDSSQSPRLTSSMATPAVLLALELREPVAPGQPLGAPFATRPNFYGKATYTVDVQVDDPYSLIFFKANDRKILDQLYAPSTVRDVVAKLDALSTFDRRFTSQRWSDLVHVVTGPDDRFITHALNGFQFPIPDNPDYVIPDQPSIKPFAGNTTPPGSSTLVPSTTRTMKDVIQEAIDGAFVPLTELPLVYGQLAQTTLQTSGRPPRLRDPNGTRLAPADSRYDPWPMAVRYEKNANGDVLQLGDPGYGNPTNTRWVRVTDYTIDGASKNVYFYYATELANTLKVSGRSPIAGPVRLINSSPPAAPVIRKIVAQLADEFDVASPSVTFKLSRYLPSEEVTSYKLYRALDVEAAASVRSMTEVREFAVDDAIADDFAELGSVPFAQPIYYRAVAFRRIVNEHGEDELIPSKPSDVAMTMVADTVHPAAPQIAMSSDPLTPAHPFQYQNVRLSWAPTAYNGRYHLYKQNDFGMWTKIATVQSNAPRIEVALRDTSLASDVLVKEDSVGNTLYHRFYVVAENSSGLVNLELKELTI
jgi:hypothetical protein